MARAGAAFVEQPSRMLLPLMPGHSTHLVSRTPPRDDLQPAFPQVRGALGGTLIVRRGPVAADSGLLQA